MITLTDHGVFLKKNWEFTEIPEAGGLSEGDISRAREEGKARTMAGRILKAHSCSENHTLLKLKFDALVSPDNNYVNILQTARASGLERFPVPYVLSNCHHTLCAVGGTINEDDHVFGLGSVKKYGGIFVPPYRAVLHQYMREQMAGCGKMILGSDSHTRYGALGTMGIGEGGGEVVKQLLGRTYDIACPLVITVKLVGTPAPGVGPQDVALALIEATFRNHFNQNKILEFVGPGIQGLSMEYRIGIDVMTTESGALSSIWCIDGKTEEYLAEHGRREAFEAMAPQEGAYYDGLIELDLSNVECMIALPFHPSNGMPIREFKENMAEILYQVEEEGRGIKGKDQEAFSIMSHVRNGKFLVDQALVSGCSGGLFENIVAMADILKGYGIPGSGLNLGINPASLPIMADLMAQGIAGELSVCGATLRPAICGPCFGVTDVPANNQLSIRHVTRNYPNREGSKPGSGQMAAVCLMDARSIAATVRNGGRLTAATDLDVDYRSLTYHFEKKIYKNQVFDCFRKGNPEEKLIKGPNIEDWPVMYCPGKHLLLKTAGSYKGSVTTDELVPSGEASSFRSNPEKIAQYTMSSRDRDYVSRAKAIRELERQRRENGKTEDEALNELLEALGKRLGCNVREITLGGLMVSDQIGDGSSREQAASCQKVLGGFANLTNEYVTKRYRSNLINWGILPLRTEAALDVREGEYLLLKNVEDAVKSMASGSSHRIELEILDSRAGVAEGRIFCTMDGLTEEEKHILLSGCLMNYYQKNKKS